MMRSGFINSYPDMLHTQNGGAQVRVGELKDEKSREAGGLRSALEPRFARLRFRSKKVLLAR